jgi:hypothetical protein
MNKELQDLLIKLETAKRNVKELLDSPESLIDMHGLSYWAEVVEQLREDVKGKI